MLFGDQEGSFNEKIYTFLLSDASKDSDPIFPWIPKRFPCIDFARCGVIRFGVDPMGNDDAWFLNEIGGCRLARGDNAIHLSYEVASEP